MEEMYVVEVTTRAAKVLIGPFDSRDKAVAFAGSTGTIMPLFQPTANAAMLQATASLLELKPLLGLNS